MRSDRASERRRVRALIQQAGVAILMTIDARGDQVGRPMLPLLLDGDPRIYFLTHQHSRKVDHVATRPRVGLVIVGEDRYVVIAGSAYTTRDAALIRRLWRPTYRAWFPAGKDDREATVLCVRVDRVDYWAPPRSRFVRVWQAAVAVATGYAVETPMRTLDGL